MAHLKARLVILLAFFAGFSLLAAPSVFAGQVDYNLFNVSISINQDSSFDVTETYDTLMSGSFTGGVKFEIPLDNSSCRSGLCGGFERIALINVKDGEGNVVPSENLEIYEIEYEDDPTDFWGVKWYIWPDGKNFVTPEQFKWSITYRIYGGMGTATQDGPSNQYKVGDRLFYWNAVPSLLGQKVASLNIDLRFPNNYTPSINSLQVFSSLPLQKKIIGNLLQVSGPGSTSSLVTVLYPIPEAIVNDFATLNLNYVSPLFGTTLNLNGLDLGEVGNQFNGLTTGNNTLVFSRSGYQSSSISLNVKEGETLNLDVDLTPTPLTSLFIAISNILNLIMVVLTFVAPVYVYRKWQKSGKDLKLSTIIPLFNPPKDVSSYMLGAILDENVDTRDITSIIIDAAHQGYIVINQDNDETTLTRTDKPLPEGTILSSVLNKIFKNGAEDSVSIKDAGFNLGIHISTIKADIYKEMVTNGYYLQAPNQVKSNYLGIGSGFIILGFVLVFVITLISIIFIGVFGPVLIFAPFVSLGLSWLAAANYMSVKTKQGQTVYEEALGFKMYVNTAERFTLQNQDPKNFEKYLSYAVAMGLERKWTNAFKDIYVQPEWLQSSSPDLLGYVLVDRFTRGLNSGITDGISSYTASVSGKGSGFGGGFGGGGFSGGGGGGGSRGGF